VYDERFAGEHGPLRSVVERVRDAVFLSHAKLLPVV
jgi:hypothetical protein